MTSRRTYLLVSAAVVALDQITKHLVARALELHDSREIVAGLASLTHVQNRGAAFGFLSTADLPHQSILFAVLSLVALMAIAAYAWRLPATQRWTQVALALIMGGAVGNLADRLHHGYVIDFVDVYWRGHHWPAFNVADSCISAGVVMLVLELLWPMEEGRVAAALPHGE
jgi:signal peptidase II